MKFDVYFSSLVVEATDVSGFWWGEDESVVEMVG